LLSRLSLLFEPYNTAQLPRGGGDSFAVSN
jgi:hypothetical protein